MIVRKPEQEITDWKVDKNGVVHFIRRDGSWGGMCSWSHFRKHFRPDLPEVPTQASGRVKTCHK